MRLVPDGVQKSVPPTGDCLMLLKPEEAYNHTLRSDLTKETNDGKEVVNMPSGKIRKAKKGKRVHACEYPGCGKIFTRAEHRKYEDVTKQATMSTPYYSVMSKVAGYHSRDQISWQDTRQGKARVTERTMLDAMSFSLWGTGPLPVIPVGAAPTGIGGCQLPLSPQPSDGWSHSSMSVPDSPQSPQVPDIFSTAYNPFSGFSHSPRPVPGLPQEAPSLVYCQTPPSTNPSDYVRPHISSTDDGKKQTRKPARKIGEHKCVACGERYIRFPNLKNHLTTHRSEADVEYSNNQGSKEITSRGELPVPSTVSDSVDRLTTGLYMAKGLPEINPDCKKQLPKVYDFTLPLGTEPRTYAWEKTMISKPKRKRRAFSDTEKKRVALVRKSGACLECKIKKRVHSELSACQYPENLLHHEKFAQVAGQTGSSSFTRPLGISERQESIEPENLVNRRQSSTSGTEQSCEISETSESDASQSWITEGDPHLAVLHSKHELLVRLMQDVYAIFDQRWTAKVHNHTGAASSTIPLRNATSQISRGSKGRKRHRDDREPTPPEDGSKKRRNDDKPSSTLEDNRPGFPSISRLKQHLKRVHSAPIQCTRCWLVMADLQAMTSHANQESRCQQNEPRPEGIAVEKMTLITSRWGATWADIYSIIFPGAPVPSPHNEDVLPEPPGGQSPQSQELANFEAYARVELPRLVEANLQTVVNAELAPIEENLRAVLVDIVRRCQSTVAQNYNRFQITSSSEIPGASNEAPAATLSPGAEHSDVSDLWATSQYRQSPLEGRGITENDITNLFEGPPLLDLPEFDLAPLELDSFRSPKIFSDSGYASYAGLHCTCRQDGDDLNINIVLSVVWSGQTTQA
ncbi:MAG: hypothetical protein Q9170_001947 [Blastenia crenularia]